MYKVILYENHFANNGTLIHGGYIQRLDEASIGKGPNVADNFQFKIYPDNPAYGTIEELVNEITVENTQLNEIVFRGRVLNIEEFHDTNNGTLYKSVICESELAYLNDSIQQFTKLTNVSVADLFRTIINQHNSNVEPFKRFVIGSVNINDTTGNKDRYLEAGITSWTAITNIISSFGGELRVHNENGTRYIDLLTTYGTLQNQVLDINKNLQTINRKRSLDNIYSVVYPYGSTIETTSTETTPAAPDGVTVATPRYTIAEVNNGQEYLINQALYKLIGWRATSQTFDTAKDPTSVLNAGKAFLNSMRAANLTYSITAFDLQPLKMAVDNFKIGQRYRFKNEFMGLDEEARIVNLTININEPQTSQITVGDKTLSLAQYNNELKNDQLRFTEQLSKLSGINNDSDELKKIIQQLQDEVNSLKPKPVNGSIIDISEWQGVIDWTATVKAGLALPIIRVQHGSSHQDLKYAENLQKLLSVGQANYAVYAYYSAVSAADAQQEATDFYNRTQTAVNGKTQPQFYAIDVEETTMDNMRGGVEAFMNTLNGFGIPDNQIVLYIANHLYDTFNLNVGRAGGIWIPSYGNNDGTVSGSTKPTHNYDLWQFTSTGSIAGITGNVDMSTEASEKFKNLYL